MIVGDAGVNAGCGGSGSAANGGGGELEVGEEGSEEGPVVADAGDDEEEEEGDREGVASVVVAVGVGGHVAAKLLTYEAKSARFSTLSNNSITNAFSLSAALITRE